MNSAMYLQHRGMNEDCASRTLKPWREFPEIWILTAPCYCCTAAVDTLDVFSIRMLRRMHVANVLKPLRQVSKRSTCKLRVLLPTIGSIRQPRARVQQSRARSRMLALLRDGTAPEHCHFFALSCTMGRIEHTLYVLGHASTSLPHLRPLSPWSYCFV